MVHLKNKAVLNSFTHGGSDQRFANRVFHNLDHNCQLGSKARSLFLFVILPLLSSTIAWCTWSISSYGKFDFTPLIFPTYFMHFTDNSNICCMFDSPISSAFRSVIKYTYRHIYSTSSIEYSRN